MATSNPWTPADDRATPYRVNVGGLRAFVQRNELTMEDESVRTDGYSSLELMQHLDALMIHRSNVLNLTRQLEQLERDISTAGCMLPHQLQLRIESVKALRNQLSEVLAMKPVILRTLRKHVATESIDVEMEHQRTFIDLFLKIGEELPRYTPVLSTLEDMDLVASDLSRRQQEFESVVTTLTATVAHYQTVYDEIHQLREVYSRLQQATTTQLPHRGA